jgi:hypothetical protein
MKTQETNSPIDSEAFRVAAEWTRIGREAAQEAIEENRRLGVPNVYSINGRIYYELPNGELSLEDPGVSSPSADGVSKSGDNVTTR